MRLASVDLPHAVLDAQQEGRLVVFAGAGVSIPHPSRLPSFKLLAERIARGTIAIEKNEPLDHFLGRAEIAGNDIQRKAREILSKPSKPNILHKSFVGIFSDLSILRIVTTNFDLHFESVIRKRWSDAETTIYHAPALPLGNNFSGLVYLHGRLERPERFILTDEDFGQAYLTRGWARRFLQDLFEKYTVLFVGYSHQDIVMNYLARGLPPKTKPTRYILTPFGGRQWEYLGIEAIVYEADKTHSRLQEFSRVWAKESQLGVLERETQIQQIVLGEPTTLTKEDEDRLLYILRRPVWAQYFFRHAAAPGWLEWADSHEILNSLFGSPSPDHVVSDVSDWFCRDPLGERGFTAARIASLRKGPLHPVFWRVLGDRIWRAVMKIPDRTPGQTRLLASWLTILVHREPVDAWGWDSVRYLLKEIALPQETDVLLELFRVLTFPFIKSSETFFPDISSEKSIDHEIHIRADNYCLECFLGSLKVHVEILAEPVLWIAISSLDHAYRLLGLLEGDDSDSLSWRRSRVAQVESHPYTPILSLVDIARVAIDWLAENRPQFLAHLLLSLVEGKSPLVRRLCIYGIRVLPVLPPEEKVDLLISHRWLEFQLRPETFELLAHCYPMLSEKRRREFLNAADEGYRREYERIREANPEAPEFDSYYMLQLLAWLEKADQSCHLVQERLAAIRRAHPDYSVSLHPDLDHWVTKGPRGIETVSPYSIDEIQSWTPETFPARLAELLAERPQGRRMFDPHIHGYLEQVADLVSEKPELGLAIGTELAKHGDAENRLWPYLFRGWSKATERDAIWERVARLMSGHPHIITQRLAFDVAQFLMERVRDRKAPMPKSMIENGIEVARVVAEANIRDEPPEDFGGNWFQLAINRSLGIIALFGIHALELLWIEHGEPQDWEIPDPFRFLFEQLLKNSPSGRSVLGGFLQFLFPRDEVWTKACLLPLFSWRTDAESSLQVWSGFIASGALTPPVRVTLLPYLGELLDNFGHLNNYLRRHLPADVAWFAYLDEVDPFTWLRRFLATSTDVERAAFAEQIGEILRGLKPDQKEELWKNWLERYFRSRLSDAPRIENRETVSFLEWCEVFPERLADLAGSLVDLKHPEVDFHKLHKLLTSEDTFLVPDAFGRILLWILRGQRKEGFFGYYCEELRNVLERLRGRIESAVYQKLVERYSELGCVGASTLLP